MLSGSVFVPGGGQCCHSPRSFSLIPLGRHEIPARSVWLAFCTGIHQGRGYLDYRPPRLEASSRMGQRQYRKLWRRSFQDYCSGRIGRSFFYLSSIISYPMGVPTAGKIHQSSKERFFTVRLSSHRPMRIKKRLSTIRFSAKQGLHH